VRASFALLLLALFACRKVPPPGPVHFAREEVTLDIRPGVLEVRGNYHFTCSATDRLVAVISYPFPVDSANLYPDSIVIAGAGHDRNPPGISGRVPSPAYRYERSDTAVSFRMRFRPGEEDSFFAYYRQPLRTNSARYIVTTTRKWQRAIDLAQFLVTVPASFHDVKLTYKPDSVVKKDSTVSYYFAHRRFFPDTDIVVTWR